MVKSRMVERAGDNYEEQEQKMVTGESDERVSISRGCGWCNELEDHR